MNANRSGKTKLTMTVGKLRSIVHEAVKYGQAAPEASEEDRRAYIREVIKDLEWSKL